MKFSQVLAAVVTLAVAIGVVSWIAGQARLRTVATADPPASVPPPANDGHDPHHGHDHDHGHDHAHDEPGKIDYYAENPFVAADVAGELPVAEVSQEVHVVGRMAKGSKGEHDFVIRNVGRAPLKLAKGPTNCKCTVAGLKDQEVPPGGEAIIHLEFNPNATGPFRQGATIWTNDPKKQEISLFVEADIVMEVVAEPESSWLLGTIPTGQESRFDGVLYSALFDEFEITEIETSTDLLSLTAEPFSDGDKAQYEARSGYRLFGLLRPSETAGQVTEKIVVRTNLKDYPEFEYLVSGHRSGPVMIVGPGWFAGRQLFEMGVVSAREGKTRKLTLMVDQFGEPLQFTGVQSNPAFVKVGLQPEAMGTGKRERYTLTLEVPAGVALGHWPAEQPGELVIKTNHPRQPELLIKLQLEVR